MLARRPTNPQDSCTSLRQMECKGKQHKWKETGIGKEHETDLGVRAGEHSLIEHPRGTLRTLPKIGRHSSSVRSRPVLEVSTAFTFAFPFLFSGLAAQLLTTRQPWSRQVSRLRCGVAPPRQRASSQRRDGGISRPPTSQQLKGLGHQTPNPGARARQRCLTTPQSSVVWLRGTTSPEPCV